MEVGPFGTMEDVEAMTCELCGKPGHKIKKGKYVPRRPPGPLDFNIHWEEQWIIWCKNRPVSRSYWAKMRRVG